MRFLCLVLGILIVAIPGLCQSGESLKCECEKESDTGYYCKEWSCEYEATTSKCFPGSSTVYMEDSTVKRMDQLQIGDSVATIVDGRVEYLPIIGFNDRRPAEVYEYLVVTTETSGTSNQRELRISSEHVLFTPTSNESGDSIEMEVAGIGPLSSIFAAELHAGCHIISIEDSKPHRATVISVESDLYQGAYAPFTAEGTIIVDGVFASSYALFRDHSVAHAFMKPYIWYHTMKTWSGVEVSTETDASGFLPYAAFLKDSLFDSHVMRWWFSGELFYDHRDAM
eukprot:Rmarinus@m.23656